MINIYMYTSLTQKFSNLQYTCTCMWPKGPLGHRFLHINYSCTYTENCTTTMNWECCNGNSVLCYRYNLCPQHGGFFLFLLVYFLGLVYWSWAERFTLTPCFLLAFLRVRAVHGSGTRHPCGDCLPPNSLQSHRSQHLCPNLPLCQVRKSSHSHSQVTSI